MEMTPEIISVFAILHSNARCDFEHHRIETLKRDLINPPQIEIIDSAHQKFNGIVYRKNNTGHFVYYNSLHREVYAYYNGEIPDGDYEVHHVDFDASNNEPANLQLLTNREHRKIHGAAKRNPPKREKKQLFVCECCGKEYMAFNTGQNRFCSKRCLLKYHRAHTKEIRQCPVCHEPFEVYKNDKRQYCSRKCADQAHREEILRKLPPKKCDLCGMEFQPKSSRQKYCCMACSRKGRHLKHPSTKYRETRICAWCGKEFETSKYRQTRFCSAHCVVSSNWEKRKK